jgi:hypothetical protein
MMGLLHRREQKEKIIESSHHSINPLVDRSHTAITLPPTPILTSS